jgi:hypothetical protein
MENKKPIEDEANGDEANGDETKKLTFAVIYMSMFVLVLYGLGPMI